MKRTFSAVMFVGFALAVFQGAPAEAQTGASSMFEVVPTSNENLNNALFAAPAFSANDI
jgi:hypothetical protein